MGAVTFIFDDGRSIVIPELIQALLLDARHISNRHIDENVARKYDMTPVSILVGKAIEDAASSFEARVPEST